MTETWQPKKEPPGPWQEPRRLRSQVRFWQSRRGGSEVCLSEVVTELETTRSRKSIMRPNCLDWKAAAYLPSTRTLVRCSHFLHEITYNSQRDSPNSKENNETRNCLRNGHFRRPVRPRCDPGSGHGPR